MADPDFSYFSEPIRVQRETAEKLLVKAEELKQKIASEEDEHTRQILQDMRQFLLRQSLELGKSANSASTSASSIFTFVNKST